MSVTGSFSVSLTSRVRNSGMPPGCESSTFSFVAAFSKNLRAVNWRTVGSGMALQLALALFILKFEIAGVRPGYELFSRVADMVKRFLEFTNLGSQFVFRVLADPAAMEKVFGPGNGFIFAFTALPTIIFVSSFFTVLYYFGVLQFIVRLFARAMMLLMGTSGAETLSAAANVFMGQTEAPIIVKPYVPSMTQSELLALMVGGLATISGGVMAVYIALGADPVAILTTSVMAAPCGLYLAKILYPETDEPVTRGEVKVTVERQHTNVIDAAAAGASDGTVLEPFVANRFTRLPLVVGQGAEKQAQEFLAVLARYPEVGGQVRASILIAERRWNRWKGPSPGASAKSSPPC